MKSDLKQLVEMGTIETEKVGTDASLLQYCAKGALQRREEKRKIEEGSRFDLSSFSSVKKVQFGNDWLVGLTVDGRVVYSKDKNSDNSYSLPSEVTNIRQNVSDIVISGQWIYILQEDGTVVSAHFSSSLLSSKYDYSSYISSVQTEISKWRDIVYIQPVIYGVIGEDIHGNVFYQSTDCASQESGDTTKYSVAYHSDIETVIEGWKDIVYISSHLKSYSYTDSKHVLGVHADGTVSSLGTGTYFTLEESTTSSKKYDYYAKTHNDGTFDKVDSWKLW